MSLKTPDKRSSACLDSEDSCRIRLASVPFVTHSNSLTMLTLAMAAALAARPWPVAAAIVLISGFISPGGRGSVELETFTGSMTRCWSGILASNNVLPLWLTINKGNRFVDEHQLLFQRSSSNARINK